MRVYRVNLSCIDYVDSLFSRGHFARYHRSSHRLQLYCASSGHFFIIEWNARVISGDKVQPDHPVPIYMYVYIICIHTEPRSVSREIETSSRRDSHRSEGPCVRPPPCSPFLLGFWGPRWRSTAPLCPHTVQQRNRAIVVQFRRCEAKERVLGSLVTRECHRGTRRRRKKRKRAVVMNKN